MGKPHDRNQFGNDTMMKGEKDETHGNVIEPGVEPKHKKRFETINGSETKNHGGEKIRPSPLQTTLLKGTKNWVDHDISGAKKSRKRYGENV